MVRADPIGLPTMEGDTSKPCSLSNITSLSLPQR